MSKRKVVRFAIPDDYLVMLSREPLRQVLKYKSTSARWNHLAAMRQQTESIRAGTREAVDEDEKEDEKYDADGKRVYTSKLEESAAKVGDAIASALALLRKTMEEDRANFGPRRGEQSRGRRDYGGRGQNEIYGAPAPPWSFGDVGGRNVGVKRQREDEAGARVRKVPKVQAESVDDISRTRLPELQEPVEETLQSVLVDDISRTRSPDLQEPVEESLQEPAEELLQEPVEKLLRSGLVESHEEVAGSNSKATLSERQVELDVMEDRIESHNTAVDRSPTLLAPESGVNIKDDALKPARPPLRRSPRLREKAEALLRRMEELAKIKTLTQVRISQKVPQTRQQTLRTTHQIISTER